MTFSIAETFYSIQGEGVWAGTPMFFVRLAGCNVGKYQTSKSHLPDYRPGQAFEDLGYDEQGKLEPSPFQLLHPEYATCTSFSGEKFICDTDYRVKERLKVEQIAALMPPMNHVVLTGGEPMMHRNIYDLIHYLTDGKYMVHIETSGTIPITQPEGTWITCSPKYGYIDENTPLINEFKFLVRDEKDEEAVLFFVDRFRIRENIFIQPIDELSEAEIDRKITRSQRDFTVECVKRHPGWRLSVQLHKYLGVR